MNAYNEDIVEAKKMHQDQPAPYINSQQPNPYETNQGSAQNLNNQYYNSPPNQGYINQNQTNQGYQGHPPSYPN